MISLPTRSFSFVVFLLYSIPSPDSGGSRAEQVELGTAKIGLSKADWSSIRAVYDDARRMPMAADDGLQALHPGQQWKTCFDGRGFTITPTDQHWSWGLELKHYGWGEHIQPVWMASAVHSAEHAIYYKWDRALTEWYKNESLGLEHGYTVHSRPADVEGDLNLQLSIRGDLIAQVERGGRDVRFVDIAGAPVLHYSGLQVTDSDGKTVDAEFVVTADGLRLTVHDLRAHYPITIDPIAQQAYIKASNTGTGDQFGYSVSVSGNTVVVGAPFEDSNATGVNGNQANDSLLDAGAAYVFVRNQGAWSQQAYLKASNTGGSDQFGFAVSISGDTIVVGANVEDSSSTGVNGDGINNAANGSGSAYVFVRNAGTWSQQAYLKASNTEAGDQFGRAVSASGDTVVVGALLEDSNATGVNGNQSDNSFPSAGAVYVFTRSGTTWTQQAYLKASNTGTNDQFGCSVSISLDTVLVGASLEASNATGVNGNQSNDSLGNAGAAYVFTRSGTTWSQQAYLKASNTGSPDEFGHSVSISGDTAVVGARGEASNATGVNGIQTNNSLSSAGAAYVFTRSGSTWSQQAYLKASNTGGGDQFGYSVSVSGNTVAVGATMEDSNSTGINGDGTNNLAISAGAVYTFARSGTVWSPEAYMKASNSGGNDTFGWSVSISGDLLVVGANGESSNATGINGNQLSNAATSSGAIYTFDLDHNAGTSNYGTGTPGCTGTETLGVTHEPMLNSPNFAITCSNAPPLSLGLGLVTDSQDLAGSDPFALGVLIHSDFIFATEVMSFDFYSDGTGYSETVGTNIPNDINLLGKTFYASALWAWTSCTLPGFNPYNLSTSRGLAITILVP